MPDKAIPWWSPQIGAEEFEQVRQVLESSYVNEGEITARFERGIAELAGAKHAVAVTSGTTALFLALVGVGVGPGDEVVVPDVTFIATANAVTLAGARPVLVDVDPCSLTLDPDGFARAITPRTKAVIPVHVSGRSADLPAILDIANRHHITVIEDAAEALLSKFRGKCLGTFGKAGCLSFSPNKTITTGQGGMVLTDDDSLCVRLRELKDQGRSSRGTGGDDLHPRIGYNFKLTNLQAAVGLGQLSYLDQRLQRQRRNYILYRNLLASVPGIQVLKFDIEGQEVPQWTDALVHDRDALVAHLSEQNIHCRRYWFPLHTQPPYRLNDADFPNSTALGPQALWLPSAFTLRDDDVEAVCGQVCEFLQNDRVFNRT